MLNEEPLVDRLTDGLSDAARTVWAKQDRDSDGWLPLWRYLADSGAVTGTQLLKPFDLLHRIIR